MNVKRSVRRALASLATAAVLVPTQAISAEATSLEPALMAGTQPAVRIADISLSNGGMLTGQVFDPALQPVAGATVAIQSGGHTLATTTTDARGAFAVKGLRGGVHQISTGESVETCRLWAEGTAPPAAQANVKLVPGQVVRGQQYCEPCSPHPTIHQKTKAWCTNPCIVGGIVGAAVAGPIILHNLDDDNDSGS